MAGMNRTLVALMCWMLIAGVPVGLSAGVTAAVDRTARSTELEAATPTPSIVPGAAGTPTVLCEDPHPTCVPNPLTPPTDVDN